VLGDISHELAERVGRGEFDSLPRDRVREALEAVWDGLVRTKHQLLLEVWRLAPIPPPERWPGYQLTRVRLLRSLAQALTRRGERRPTFEPRVANVLVERKLEPPGMPLRGRVDRVEINDAGVHLVDIKTGWDGDEVREEHRQQLLLYAAMWRQITSEWPRLASIQAADGRRVSFTVDPDEADAVAAEAVAALEAYNRTVQRNVSPSELASPSAQSCRYCPYRGICSPFFQALTPDWGWWLKSLAGTLTDVTGDAEQRALTIRIEASNFDTQSGSSAHVLAVPCEVVPTLGAQIAIIDACPTPQVAEVRVTWSTQLVLL
jgi:RecB family exonuclease